ncbi:unnamed protein product [Hymenolepis diminuta]|uniref:Uncharacterized protein n=1 Tax=Hymenolepis diminuta TaxID=6216 RepID=A0A564Z0Y3_HYMDI|nr:unnamed protein product [Hymenolepis diminuta]
MFSRVLIQVTHIKLSLFSTQEQRIGSYASCSSLLFLSTLPLPFLIHSSQTRCGFLEYIFGLINSWCSASQLSSTLTQTATNR